jgi:hypothetical protein
MSERDQYPAGVPCWVDTLVPDPDAALHFYGGIFDWEFSAPGPIGDGLGYHVARVRGADVAGVGAQPDPATPSGWNTYVAVESVAAATARAAQAGAEILTGPTDASPAGSFAVVADPTGASLCLWEAGTRQGAQRVNEFSAWAMSALQTPDPEHATAFYSELFGWQPEPFDAGEVQVTLMRLPGYVGGEPQQPVPRDVVAAVMSSAEDDAPAGWSVDFWIDDANAAAGRAAELGGQVLVAPHDVAGFRRTVLADPAGSAFSVSTLIGP